MEALERRPGVQVACAAAVGLAAILLYRTASAGRLPRARCICTQLRPTCTAITAPGAKGLNRSSSSVALASWPGSLMRWIASWPPCGTARAVAAKPVADACACTRAATTAAGRSASASSVHSTRAARIYWA